MLSRPPAYFEKVRAAAARRWEQLEGDRELAGPWRQLFSQVQSPRHVLSELLQNADDAGATEAAVRIEGQQFIFEHNGEDFTEEHFASLCRFGYSSKRALHTIGFRGIGFKSTFSLGDPVSLCTPTLAVRFYRRRFTEPVWSGDALRTDRKTCVFVPIADPHRRDALERNFKEWTESPVSLLFFRNLRRIQIGDQAIHWASMGPGPVPGSEWMAMYGAEDKPVLIVRSEAEAFPAEALAEIKQERTLSDDEQADFPPCKIELVLGVEGRIFVVLPTGVRTQLPFACNAPFVARPDREDIKDPAISPTNRWLLERTGKLAASVMLAWLGQTDTKTIERAPAYGFFPDVDTEDESLEGRCGTIVEEVFVEAIDGQRVLLIESGELTAAGGSIIVPQKILDVWPGDQASAFLDEQERPCLSQYVCEADREKLQRRGLVEEISKETLINTLQTERLPRPETWRRLLNLWSYIAPDITGYRRYGRADSVRIVPVQGQDVLYSAREVVRLGDKRLLQSDDDWEFLSGHLVVLNPNWPRFLTEQRRLAEEKEDEALQELVEDAYSVLRETGLEESSDIDKVVDRVAAGFFAEGSVPLSDCVRLAHIAAKLGATAGDSFRLVTRDLTPRSRSAPVLYDEDGWLEELIPDDEAEERLLHPDYTASFTSCSKDDWQKWISQGRSGLHTFVPLRPVRKTIYGRAQATQEAAKRGQQGGLSYQYVTNQFVLEDWDFGDSYWQHWTSLAQDDADVWGRVAERMLAQQASYWSQCTDAKLKQVGTTGNQRTVAFDPLLPTWLLRLRDLRCLPDTHRVYCKPSDLLRRTPETESLLDLEPFVHGLLDNEKSRPLLDLLGVRSSPLGPDSLIARVRILAKMANPPAGEAEKWYRRLDQMADACSTESFQRIRDAFHAEKLILTEDGSWAVAGAVFQSSDEEDVPSAAVIKVSVRELSFWRKIGVQPRPTAELAIRWLKGLTPGTALSADELKRIRPLLVRYPERIWDECGHWLSLAGEWVPVGQLEFALSMQSLTPWAHLHVWVKQKTADFQRLQSAIVSAQPFSALPALSSRIEERFQRAPTLSGSAQAKEWMKVFGSELRRAVLETEEETQRVRSLARLLAKTSWQRTPGLEIIPYIDETPAGTARRVDVLWLDDVLYVDNLPKAKLARRVPEEIGKSFGREDINAALNYGFERDAEDVRDYLDENFALDAQLAADVDAPEHDGVGTERGNRADDAAGPQETEVPANGADAADRSEHDAPDPDAEEDINGAEVDEPITASQRPPRAPPRPRKLSIIERFAREHGFRQNGEDRFVHADGSLIGRSRDSRFPWERRHASGDIERFYWPEDHCIESEPLQLAADVWGLIDDRPDQYALILSDLEGAPVEVTGARLRAMCEQGELTLYPATYRIVYNDKNV